MHESSFGVALLLGLTIAANALAEEAEDEVAAEAIVEQTSVGEAISETAAPGWTYPKAYAARELTMESFMMRGTFQVGVQRAAGLNIAATDGTLVSIDFGAAFAPIDNLEVGVTAYRLGSSPAKVAQALFPIIVSPVGSFGDMPVYVRYAFLKKDYLEVGADLVVIIPSKTSFAMTVGVPMRIRARERLTIDTGFELTVLTKSAGLNIDLPIKATFSITKQGFIFGDSGFSFQNIARNTQDISSSTAFNITKNQVFVPLGVGGGYTVLIRGEVMMDIYARFGWNPFVYMNPPGGVDVVPVRDTWILGVGTIIYTRPFEPEKDS